MVRKTGGRGRNGVGGVLPDTIVLERLGILFTILNFYPVSFLSLTRRRPQADGPCGTPESKLRGLYIYLIN